MQGKYKFKVCVVGEYAVGKTSLITRFVKNSFEHDYKATLGANVLRKAYTEESGTEINLIIWDIAGQDLFERTRRQFYGTASGVVYVYDVTRRDSFEAIRKWRDEIVSSIDTEFKQLLVANKNDLDPIVTSEEGKKLAEELSMTFIETSAKTSMNVEEAFKKLAKMLVEMGSNH
ncbi:MAG: Rab family GTPase [Candidatus Helarchaeota archaeon]